MNRPPDVSYWAQIERATGGVSTTPAFATDLELEAWLARHRHDGDIAQAYRREVWPGGRFRDVPLRTPQPSLS